MRLSHLDQTLALLPQKVLFWEEKKTLVISDLHLGKTTVFRRAGIPVPEGSMEVDLRILLNLFDTYPVERCIIVGDLFHHKTGFTEKSLTIIQNWLNRLPVKPELVLGNHDRALSSINHTNWNLTIHSTPLLIAPYAFVHEPQIIENYFTWAGHLHPVVYVRESKGFLRLPCFIIKDRVGILPSYGSFTGGMKIRKDDKAVCIYPILDGYVFQLQ